MVKVDSLIEEAVTPNAARRYINCKLSSGYEQEAFSVCLNNYERVFTLIPPPSPLKKYTVIPLSLRDKINVR